MVTGSFYPAGQSADLAAAHIEYRQFDGAFPIQRVADCRDRIEGIGVVLPQTEDFYRSCVRDRSDRIVGHQGGIDMDQQFVELSP